MATGITDYVSNGEEVIKIENGTSKLKGITGTGCMTGSLIGSYLGISDNSLEAAAMGVLSMALAGELADKNNISIGSFKVELMNQIYELNSEKFLAYAKLNKF